MLLPCSHRLYVLGQRCVCVAALTLGVASAKLPYAEFTAKSSLIPVDPMHDMTAVNLADARISL